MITSFDMSILFCSRLEICILTYAIAVSTSLWMRIARSEVSTSSRVSAQLSRRAVSIPFMSM